MAVTEVHGASYRDPAGFVYTRDGVLLRQVNRKFEEEFAAVRASGLYDELMADGLLVRHEEVSLDHAATPEAARVLRPEPIPFVSHPYEWCFGQLRAAALLTLEIQERAFRKGFTLRDASAFNVQFRGTCPVFIDTLSLRRYREGEPWLPYHQFCTHFLAPLRLMADRDPGLGRLLRVHLDGIPLDLASVLLPLRSRLRPSDLLHIHAHARSIARSAAKDISRNLESRTAQGGGRRERTVSQRGLEGIVDSLRSAVRRMALPRRKSTWVDYPESRRYSGATLDAKREVVARVVREVAPGTAWDLGANNAEFSRIAAANGADHVVACEMDPLAVERAFRETASDAAVATRVLPVCIDLRNPSPASGWALRERASLEERGPADLVLALALVHHLALAGNVPLASIADWFAGLASTVLVEWVPKQDVQAKRLLASREDVFPGYTREGFEEAFGTRFHVAARFPLPDSERTLYVLRHRAE